MSWFEEQIKERKLKDSEMFSDSIENICNSITGRKKSADIKEAENDEIRRILGFYGLKGRNLQPDEEKTDLNTRISLILRTTGVMFRRIKLTQNWYKDSIGAVLSFKEDGSPVALLPDGFGYYFIRNGKKERVSRKNADELGSEGYCFYKPFPNRKLNLIDLIKYALSGIGIKNIALLVCFMGLTTLVGLLSPKLSYFLYSNVVESKSNMLLLSTAFFFLCVNVSTILLSSFRSMFNGTITTKMRIGIESATMMRIFSLSPSFFRKYSSGEMAERSNYIPTLSEMLMGIILEAGFSSLLSLVYITSIFKYAPSLVIPSLIIILLSVAFSIVTALSRKKISKECMEIRSKEMGMTYQMISGIKKIRNAGAEKRAFARWADLYSEETGRTYNPPAFLKFCNIISLAITTLGTITMYVVSIKSGVDMAEYTAFNAAYSMLFGAFSSLSNLVSTYSDLRPVIDMAKPIMDEVPEISDNKQTVSKVDGRIEFSNVVFSYDEKMPNVVDNMSFKIEPDRYIGIVGKTGCGKSTVIRLLLGFEKPDKGAIYYDGKDLDTLDLKSLRKKIGVVMQDGKLFQGDIFSNITISAPWLNMDAAWEAAEIAGIAEDIERMPMGMHTILTEGGGSISGGQKQRLIIARAIAPKPKILIFDEATSALDNVTQKKISEALDKLHCTRIVIAHRLSTVKHCDRILYLGDGKILEDGTYDELIEKKGLFYELVERQRLDK